MEPLQSFREAFSRLTNLKEFSVEAFIATEKTEQQICDFILTLALIYNDIKNIDLCASLLGASKPEGEFTPCPAWGEYSALAFFFNRLRISIINELMNLIKNYGTLIEEPLFERTIKQISTKSRESWQLIVDATISNGEMSPIRNPYFMIRNKTIFHYDIKQISAGYRDFFRKLRPNLPPMISRGMQMIQTRLYFADAAAEGCLNLALGNKPVHEFFSQLENNLSHLNQALQDIVQKFITIRAPGWKRVRY